MSVPPLPLLNSEREVFADLILVSSRDYWLPVPFWYELGILEEYVSYLRKVLLTL
jgi:hypothetical protein